MEDKQKPAIICPQMTGQDRGGYCLHQPGMATPYQCAWWDEKQCECSVLVVAKSLKRISMAVEAVEDGWETEPSLRTKLLGVVQTLNT